MITVKLTTPVIAHGEEINEITLNEPTTENLIDIGLPTLVIPGDGGETGVEIRQHVIARYIVKLGSVPLSTVKSLSLSDFSSLTTVVMRFFNQSDTENPSS